MLAGADMWTACRTYARLSKRLVSVAVRCLGARPVVRTSRTRYRKLSREDHMPRTLYTEEHEDFRAAAREFVERSLKPRVEEMISLKSITRDIWIEAGQIR